MQKIQKLLSLFIVSRNIKYFILSFNEEEIVCYPYSHTNAYYRHHEMYNVTWVRQKIGKYKDFQLPVRTGLFAHCIAFFFSPIH